MGETPTAGEWGARANREAAAILARHGVPAGAPLPYSTLTGLLAVAWLQGVNAGTRETLADAAQTLDRTLAALRS